MIHPLPLNQLNAARFETPVILRKLAATSRRLAELKGVAAVIPNQGILINNLFTHPYTKIEYVERDVKVTRQTATKYLEALSAGGILEKPKVGRSNCYIDIALNAILTGDAMRENAEKIRAGNDLTRN